MSDDEPLGEYQQKLARRSELVTHTQRITGELTRLNAGPWIPERDTLRQVLIADLQVKEEELRTVKAWLRMNSPSGSEWVLLGQLYRFLMALDIGKALPENAEGEVDVLLDSIERLVPSKYLNEKAAK